MRWGDMDAQGHVNNAAYVTYLEEARTRYLERGPQHLLDDGIDDAGHPVLPATLDTVAETLLMRRYAGDGRLDVLRLWPAPVHLDSGEPLWVGTSQSMHYTRHFGVLGLWQPQSDAQIVHQGLREVLESFGPREDVHPQSGVPTLRLRTTDAASLVVDEP